MMAFCSNIDVAQAKYKLDDFTHLLLVCCKQSYQSLQEFKRPLIIVHLLLNLLVVLSLQLESEYLLIVVIQICSNHMHGAFLADFEIRVVVHQSSQQVRFKELANADLV